MKTRILLLLTICAVITLSFTFGSTAKREHKTSPSVHSTEHNAELKGGFVSEDKL